MKKLLQFSNLLLAMTLTSSLPPETSGQVCRVKRDSVITAGRGDYRDYNYDGLGRIISVIHRSGSMDFWIDLVSEYDALTGKIKKTASYNPNDTTQHYYIEYVINGGRVTRMNAWGQDSTGVGLWSTSHDISYNGSGQITNIILDPSSVSGSPGVFPASFSSMAWQNGNVTSVTLTVGSDNLQLAVTYDSKNNLQSKLLGTDGASSFFESLNANNIVRVVTSAAGTFMGNPVPAGTVILDRAYTYTASNDVDVMTEYPGFFNSGGDTTRTKYMYECSSGIFTTPQVSNLVIYPNPAADVIGIENGHFSGTIKIFDISGKEVCRTEITGQLSALTVSDLKPGLYYVEMTDGPRTSRGKILKN